MKNSLTKRQKELLSIIYQYIQETGYPPTFDDMKEKLEVVSNQSIIDLLEKLKIGGCIKRDEGARSLVILPLGYEILGKPPLAPFVGAVSAGFPLETITVTGEWRAVSPELKKMDDVFLMQISGDSMINAGLNEGDVVLVKNAKEFVSGEIVLAQVGSDLTIKRFMSEDKPPYVWLQPENPKYPIMPFTDETELKGKVISILNTGLWKPVK